MTAVRFLGTTVVLGVATAAISSPAWCMPAAVLAVMKLIVECALMNRAGGSMAATRVLLDGPVGLEARLRVALVALGAVAAPFSPPWSLALLAASECLERIVFFRAAAAWRMPGTR
jgi:hypothetical protein